MIRVPVGVEKNINNAVDELTRIRSSILRLPTDDVSIVLDE